RLRLLDTISRRQALDFPAAALLMRVEKPIVQAIFPALPEFDLLWRHAVAAPEIRQRNFSLRELLLHPLPLHREDFARGDHAALVGNPSRNLTPARTRYEIPERFGRRNALGAAS